MKQFRFLYFAVKAQFLRKCNGNLYRFGRLYLFHRTIFCLFLKMKAEINVAQIFHSLILRIFLQQPGIRCLLVRHQLRILQVFIVCRRFYGNCGSAVSDNNILLFEDPFFFRFFFRFYYNLCIFRYLFTYIGKTICFCSICHFCRQSFPAAGDFQKGIAFIQCNSEGKFFFLFRSVRAFHGNSIFIINISQFKSGFFFNIISGYAVSGHTAVCCFRFSFRFRFCLSFFCFCW